MIVNATALRLAALILLTTPFFLATQSFAQTPKGSRPASSSSLVAAPRSTEQELSLLLLVRVANDLKSEPDHPAAALIQAEIGDTLWKFDELQARAIFAMAWDSARQEILVTSTLDKEEARQHLDLLKRQAKAIREVARLFAKHDRETADRWLESLNQDALKKANPTQPSNDRTEFLAELALSEVKTNPVDAEKLGILSLEGTAVPSAFGPLLITMGSVDKTLADTLFRAAILALLRNNSPNGSILSALSNYLFFVNGNVFSKNDTANVRLFTDYLIEGATNQVSLLRDSRSTGTVPQSVISMATFLSVRGNLIVERNAPDKLQLLRPLLNELIAALTPQQVDDIANTASTTNQQQRMDSSLGGDLDSVIDRAEHEKDDRVRDYMWRALAIGAMRGDSDQALKFADKIGDESMRAQTEDDVNLAIIADRVRSASYVDAREAALKFHDKNLRAKTLAEVADRALAGSRDRTLGADLLSEALSIVNTAEPSADRAAITLLLAQKFAKFDLNRAFEIAEAAVKTINSVESASPAGNQQTQHHGVRILSFTVVGGAELSTGQHESLDSLAFDALTPLAASDYYRVRNLGESVQNKLIRARYLIALARGVLGVSVSQKPSQPF